jgi:predicted nucleic acid-binding protein
VGKALITLDTSGLFTLLNRKDEDHERVRAAFIQDKGPYLVPAGILAEISYMIERRLGEKVLEAFVADLEARRFVLECGEDDFGRIRELIGRYADLSLGFADASVISCAERNGGKVLTLDLRHFGVVAKEGNISVLP